MSTAGSEVRGAARRAARSPVMDMATRVGLACRGVLYGLVGAVAVQVGLGERSKEADKAGAIETLAELPFGSVLLWIMTVGFVALALWQATEAAFGGGEVIERVEAAARVAVYVLVIVTLVSVLTKGKASSDDEKSRDLTATLLDLPGGQVIVGAAGLGLVVLGAYWVRQGLTKGFWKELDRAGMPAPARAVMERLGVGGYVARGAVAALAGILVGRAAITFDPDKAGGIDTALREFAGTPAGPWLLVVVALGLLLFAAFCFGEARWRRA
ncbi:DUF1206 domain-containing protein [Nonomuraea sp. NPDC050783]|uniref:DUF1206 domain-containing protein n=1 Tax=Nonomuraea sp. NPDC050783 TaxID=3154634 RepID=UPI003465F964